ncbi:MAG: PqqD family protein [Candidatus Wallbacteria bacterium]|nr:PqqD family protein [Candidatus Wallbacteria bacterium]
MTLERHTRVVRAEEMMSAPIDNEIVILNLPRDNYVGLDEIARRIWELLEQPLPVEELCARLAAEYEGPTEQIEADVLGFLSELEKEGLLRVVAEPGA